MRPLHDLLLGARISLGGGRDAWARMALIAVGTSLGVALLLLAASVPGALQQREERGMARSTLGFGQQLTGPADDTILIASVETQFRDEGVYGRLVLAEGGNPPLPPGVTVFPQPGEVVVSPALADLLASPDGELFAPRLGGATVIGLIADEGLTSPGELAFYLGSDTLTEEEGGQATRLNEFAHGLTAEPLGPVLRFLIVVMTVVLLLPIVVFQTTSARFGGEGRDRRLAALRLIGADSAMVRRLAAGETLLGAGIGAALGSALFAVGRQFAPLVSVGSLSVFSGDLRPGLAIGALVVLLAPTLAVAAALASLRGVIIEPLGVTRRAGIVRRRLWWRLIPLALGGALLLPLIGSVGDAEVANSEQIPWYQVAAGVVLFLLSTVSLLPWLIEAAIGSLDGSPVSWHLAVRRLRFHNSSAIRLVNGIVVAVAGTIGLQMIFVPIQAQYTSQSTADPDRATAMARLDTEVDPTDPTRAIDQLAVVSGVTVNTGVLETWVSIDPEVAIPMIIGTCSDLAEYAELDTCADGRVFLSGPDEEQGLSARLVPGTTIALAWVAQDSAGDQDSSQQPEWTVPVSAEYVAGRQDPSGGTFQSPTLLVTLGAIDLGQLGTPETLVYVTTDPDDPDAVERLRNAVVAVDRFGYVNEYSATEENRQFTRVRLGLYAGSLVTLALLAISLVVGTLEQVREQRRLLATLVASGARRSSLLWSLFWQTAIPVAIGLVTAIGVGMLLGALLLRVIGYPVTVSWSVIGVATGLAAGVVLLANAVSLPAVLRLVRVEHLRAE